MAKSVIFFFHDGGEAEFVVGEKEVSKINFSLETLQASIAFSDGRKKMYFGVPFVVNV